jgi:hypothetical protein
MNAEELRVGLTRASLQGVVRFLIGRALRLLSTGYLTGLREHCLVTVTI